MDAHYTRYYLAQSGSGLSDIGRLYRGPVIIQRGRGGVGDFFGAVFRHLRPLIASGLTAVKDQSLKSGAAILQDLGRKPINQILKEQVNTAVQELAQKGIDKLKRMQAGKGARRRRKRGIKRLAENNLKQFAIKAKRIKQSGGRKKKIISKKDSRRTRKRSNKRKRVLDIFD